MIGKTTCNWNDFLSQRKCISGKISFVSVTPVIGISLLSLRSLTDCLNKLFVYLKLCHCIQNLVCIFFLLLIHVGLIFL